MTAARTVLEEGVHELADTVRNSLNYYRMQQNAVPVERAILTGPAVAVPGLPEQLAEALGMPVEARTVAVQGEIARPAHLAIAAGLAVDSV